MSNRPVFIPTDSDKFVDEKNIEFKWHAGLSTSQKQKSVESLHKAILDNHGLSPILEISTKSLDEIGVKASAFNLMLTLKNGVTASVESFYQGSKVFEGGGPYIDLYSCSSYEAKKDLRLNNSGKLIGFAFSNTKWGLNEFFYDWLYINGLLQNDSIAKKFKNYAGFTDIEFNPAKSYNCQAYSAALYVSAHLKGLNINSVKSKTEFLKLFPPKKLKIFQLDLF